MPDEDPSPDGAGMGYLYERCEALNNPLKMFRSLFDYSANFLRRKLLWERGKVHHLGCVLAPNFLKVVSSPRVPGLEGVPRQGVIL